MTHISRLIEELEKVKEGNENLDHWIKDILDPAPFTSERRIMRPPPIPPYTSCIDAALRLLPKGASLVLLLHASGRGSAAIDEAPPLKIFTAPSLPLAVCLTVLHKEYAS